MAQASKLNVLKQQAKISDKQLDCRIKEDELWELAGLLGNNELYVGVSGFNLNEADKADLKDCASVNGHQHAMTMALEKWINASYKKGQEITYRVLVEILIELSKGTVAETVCRTGEFNYYG